MVTDSSMTINIVYGVGDDQIVSGYGKGRHWDRHKPWAYIQGQVLEYGGGASVHLGVSLRGISLFISRMLLPSFVFYPNIYRA